MSVIILKVYNLFVEIEQITLVKLTNQLRSELVWKK
jgi:hypothetical protein